MSKAADASSGRLFVEEVDKLFLRKDLRGLEKLSKSKNRSVSTAAVEAQEMLMAPPDVQAKMGEIGHPDATRRAAAARSLREKGYVFGPTVLRRLAGDPDASVRRAAIEAFTTYRFTTNIDDFVKFLDDPDAANRADAACALSAFAEMPAAREALEKAITDVPGVRGWAAFGLASRHAEQLLEPCLRRLLEDPEWEVRRQVVQGLGRYAERTGSRIVIEALLGILEDRQAGSSERLAAAQELGDIAATYYVGEDPFWQDSMRRMKDMEAAEANDDVRSYLHGASVRALKLQGYR